MKPTPLQEQLNNMRNKQFKKNTNKSTIILDDKDFVLDELEDMEEHDFDN